MTIAQGQAAAMMQNSEKLTSRRMCKNGVMFPQANET
jgi:hypothetical protein